MILKFLKYSVVQLIVFGYCIEGHSQNTDHWETIVYNDDDWRYEIGSPAIPLNWIEEGFDNSNWAIGQGGFGYGDNDDNTILNNVLSVFIRKDFEIINKSLINSIVLHADYDDGFVAYLNGVEIARKNLGIKGTRTAYNEASIEIVEPFLVQELTPEGFKIDVNLLKVGINVLAIQIHNQAVSSSDLSSNFFLSAGIQNESILYGITPDWFGKSVFNSTLPILKITIPSGQEIMDEPRIMAHLGIVYNGEGQTNTPFDAFNEYDGPIAIEYRGTSSLGFDKKGYGFETRNLDSTNKNVTLIGMPKENDWILHGPYSDKSLLRNVLSYHLGELTGRYAPRTRLCELFVDDSYEGVYVLTEKIKQDKNRVDIAKMTVEDNAGDQLTGGYIIKVDRNDQNIQGLGWESTFPDYKFFAYVEPKDDQITTPQKNYIRSHMYQFELAMASQDYEDRYLDYIDIKSFVDYFLVTEISKHIDAFKLSFYMYKDKDSKGGKLHFGPLWDFNFGYGNFDFACSPDPDGWAYEFPDCGSWHPFWTRKLANIPNVQHLSNCRWKELRAGPFHTDSIMSFINQKGSKMNKAIERNFERWQILGQYVWGNDFYGETYRGEIEFFKNWVKNRLAWMDDNMLGNCDDYVTAVKEKQDLLIDIFPNPATSNFNVNWRLNEAANVSIYNSANQLVNSTLINSQEHNNVNIELLQNGVYTLIFRSVLDHSIMYSEKLVVIK